MSSHTTQPPKFLGNLTGVSFRLAETKIVVYALPVGAELQLFRDPNNEHDANAVKVQYTYDRTPTLEEWYGRADALVDANDEEEIKRTTTKIADQLFVGFIERGVAASLARWMDEGYVYIARTKTKIDHKMTPWLLEIEPTGEQLTPTFTESEGQDVAHDDDIPF